MSPVENISDEDLVGLYPVNLNAVVRNVQAYGRGNRNVSPNIRSKRLNNLPKMPGFAFGDDYEEDEPLYVPKLKQFTTRPNLTLPWPVGRVPGMRSEAKPVLAKKMSAHNNNTMNSNHPRKKPRMNNHRGGKFKTRKMKRRRVKDAALD
jgi:hypothetical protein